MPKQFQDEFDRRISAALESVDVPSELSGKIMAALQDASLAHAPSGDAVQVALAQASTDERTVLSTVPSSGPSTQRSTLLNRRNWIAATVAAGAGGLLLGYRQLTQPLSQPWLIKSSLGLLEQIESGNVQWQPIESDQAELRLLREVGFFRQVRNIGFVGSCTLRPPRNIDQATAYNLGTDARGGTLVLLDLIVERGVQGISPTLQELPQHRSDAHSLAGMQSGTHLLVLAGRGTLSKYILRGQTT